MATRMTHFISVFPLKPPMSVRAQLPDSTDPDSITGCRKKAVQARIILGQATPLTGRLAPLVAADNPVDQIREKSPP
jgi:hypothetical protein